MDPRDVESASNLASFVSEVRTSVSFVRRSDMLKKTFWMFTRRQKDEVPHSVAVGPGFGRFWARNMASYIYTDRGVPTIGTTKRSTNRRQDRLHGRCE